MSIANVTPETEITASSGQTLFAWGTWVAFADADIEVYQNGTLLTLTTHYTVDRTAKEVTLVTGATLNDVIVIRRKRALARSSDFAEIGKLRTAALNDELDYIYSYLQQVEAERVKNVRAPSYELLEMVLPALAARANKLLGFDADGLPLMSDGASIGETLASAFGESIVTAADAAAARTLLEISTFAATLLDDTTAAAMRATLGLVLGTDIYSKAAVDALVALYLPLAGGTMGGVLDMDGNAITMGTAKITGLGDPDAAQDASTKAYTDAIVGLDPLKYVRVRDDFIGGMLDPTDSILNTQMGWRVAVTGAGAGVTVGLSAPADANHPGVVKLSTGTTTSGYTTICGDQTLTTFLSGGKVRFDWVIYIANLADGTDDYEIHVGLFDNRTLASADEGVYFKYDRDTGANWLCVSEADGTATTEDSAVAVATGWVRLTAIVNAAGTSIAYYIDGSLVATITTNINTDEGMLPALTIIKEAGSTARTISVDLFSLQIDLTTSR